MSNPARYLDLAARLALRGHGAVEPNPMVGAVLVRDGRIIGMGHHRRFGGPHAEREAINACIAAGHSPRGATLYVTLEPCRGLGKTPPCTQALIEHGISRVIFARRDPHAKGRGGAEELISAGIPCEPAEVSNLALAVSDPFIRRIETGLPWVIAKWAQTIDGRTATRTGESKWISNDHSRARVHTLRSRSDAILTGIGTVLADDPMLTARRARPPRRVAARVIVDTDLDIPLTSNIVRTAHDIRTIIACDASLANAPITRDKVRALTASGVTLLPTTADRNESRLDLESLLRTLVSEHGITSVLVEAGAGLLGSLFRHDLIDECVVYIAPMLMGDEQAKGVANGSVVEHLRQTLRFDLWRAKRLANDVELSYRRCRLLDHPHG